MDSPIHILHVVDSLGKGGLENGLVNLIGGLDSGRFAHTVLAIRGLGANLDRLPLDRVQVSCLQKSDSESSILVGRLATAIRKASPDIVHSRNWGTVEAVMAGRLAGCGALVHSEHGLEVGSEAAEPFRRRAFRRLAFELASRVLCVSHQLRDLHAARTGFAARKIGVIHNGVDARVFRPDAVARSRRRAELGLADNELCIGCVGNLLPVKDHLTLLKALEGLGPDATAWRAVVLGAGPELAGLEKFLEERPALRRRVSFLGLRNQIPEWLNAMDIYVLPSISEGISNSLLEAMATKLPVIASATGGNPEVVVGGHSGLLFPVGDAESLRQALLSLISNRELRLEFGGQALRRAHEEFSLDTMVRAYDGVYTGLAAGRRLHPQRLSVRV